MARLISTTRVFVLPFQTDKLSPCILLSRGVAQGSSPGNLPAGWTPSLLEEAKRWLSDYSKSRAVPKQHIEVSFARSSGPGGQHVNKTNSKAIAKLSIDAPFIPHWAKDALRKSPSYIESSSCLQTSSVSSRSQGDNLEDCLRKLHFIVLDAAKQSIPSLPSDEQQEHVKELQRKEKARRREVKVKRKSIKSGRNAKWGD